MNRIWQAVLSLIVVVGLVIPVYATVTTYKFVDQNSTPFNIQLFQCLSGPVYCTAMILEDSSGNEKFVSGNAGFVQFPSAQSVNVNNTPSVSQSGTWTVQPGNTPNTSPWLMTISQGGNSATVNGSNQLVVDCAAGCSGGSGGTSLADQSAFTQGTTSITPIGCLAKTVYSAITSGEAGVLQCDTSGRPIIVGAGTAGSAAGGVVTVQGVGSMTPFLTNPGTAANWGVGATGSAVPANAVYLGITSGGNLTGWTGAVTNAGTFAVQDATVEGAITSSVMQVNTKQVNGVTTLAGSGAVGTGSQRVAVGTDTATIAGSAPGTAGSPSTNVISIQGESSMTAVSVSNTLGTTGGMTPLKLNALSNSAVAIKASAGQLFMLQCGNTNSSEEYVQIYNIASGSVTVGTSTPTLSIPIAATATGGFALSPVGMSFGTAISAAATTTATGGSAPSTALDCNVAYN